MDILDVEIRDIKDPDVILPQARGKEILTSHVTSIEELMESIKRKGLMHPIQVTRKKEGEKYQIIIGRKRFIACKRLGMTSIPAIIKVDIPEDEQLELSLHENLRRQNLNWYEQITLEKDLHDLRQRQHGTANPKGGKSSGWSMRDTAEELGVALGGLSQDLQLLQYVKADPTLRNVRDKTTAFMLAKRAASIIEGEQDTMIREIDFEMNVVFLGSAHEILKRLPGNIFEICLTDPPWLEYIDKGLIKDEETELAFKELFRVMYETSFLLAFVSMDDFFHYKELLSKAGFTVSKIPIIWQKENHITQGMKPWEFSRDYEPILLATKGNPTRTRSGQRSRILKYPIIPTMKQKHPNEKPLALIVDLLEECSFDGARVLDIFAGSGVVGEACQKLDRKFILIERRPDLHNQILKRLKLVKE